MKIFSTLLFVREMQIVSTIVNHYTASKWPTLTEQTPPSVCMDVEQLEFSDCCSKLYNHFGKTKANYVSTLYVTQQFHS